ncbi:MAG: hypothetical protein R3246_15850, partial [Acidimicrobiia bacterium]|nr:hypothetical protein [Acidimicrobiia bacterium]
GAWGVGFALSAFWALPLLARVRGFTADMNWSPVPYIRMVDGVAVNNVFPREMIILIVLGVIGAGWALLRRYDVGPMIWLGAIAAAGFFVIDWIGFTKLYNARLLPYWYYTVFFLAGTAGGLVVVEIARRVTRRRAALVAGTALASVFFLVAGLVSLSFAAGWARWNYTGYEGKGAWPEYEGLLQRVSELPPGRVMWEANREMDKYGTPMALMLLPYWTDESHPSMEGLLFESSLTTPFHFLNAAEVSERPSNPVRGLNYHTRSFDRALEHLPLYNVEYYVAFTDESKAKADAALERLFESPPWVVYRLPDSSLVDVATTVPAVYEGGDFLDAALNWYDRVDRLDQWLVADGPEEWPRVDDPEQPFPDRSTPVTTAGTVSDIVLEDHRIAFSTTAIG